MPQTLTYAITTADQNEEWAVVSNGGSNYTIQEAQTVMLASASSGAVTITLPDAAGTNANRVIIVKKMDATSNAVTVTGTGGDTIDGQTNFILTTQYASITVVSDGSNWNIV